MGARSDIVAIVSGVRRTHFSLRKIFPSLPDPRSLLRTKVFSEVYCAGRENHENDRRGHFHVSNELAITCNGMVRDPGRCDWVHHRLLYSLYPDPDP